MNSGPVHPELPHGLPGLLITFEGPEGSGKSTLIKGLSARLAAVGVEPVLLREPGGSAVGEKIRDILLDPELPELHPVTELLLMVASRAQLARQKLRPALEQGKLVICDRYSDASVAYQGGGRGLPYETVHALNDLAIDGLVPDLTLLCLLPPEAGRARLGDRDPDRLEKESADFHSRVYDSYRAMSERGTSRFVTLDASSPPEEILEAAWKSIIGLEHGLLNTL